MTVRGALLAKEVVSAMKQLILGKGREMNQGVELEEDVLINKSLPNYLLSKASVILLYVFANKFTTDS